MNNRTKYTIILMMMILATAMSIVLSFVSLDKACGKGTDGIGGNCTVVQTSKYESTLGIKNAHIGLIAFPILIILTILELKKSKKYQKKLLKLGIILGSAFAIYFLIIQFVILKAICKYCLVLDVGVLINLALILFWRKNEKDISRS